MLNRIPIKTILFAHLAFACFAINMLTAEVVQRPAGPEPAFMSYWNLGNSVDSKQLIINLLWPRHRNLLILLESKCPRSYEVIYSTART
jgi:hypothetical protein